ncbi:MAG: hypothetical protein MJD61_21335, partial [Proteobacteria bacterium]|nr:hypothetical protein [Pseudomonadota bacterium]
PVPSAPKAYVLDPAGVATCSPPANYVYDPRLDEVNFAEQGNVFTKLPSAKYAEGALPSSKYAPVVSRAPVDLGGAACQRVKSENGLVQALGLAGPADLPADGQLLAWLVIDPAAAVYPLGQSEKAGHSGLGLQRWGWLDRYLLAYLDGGPIPTAPVPNTMSTQLLAQKLYIPSLVATDPADPSKTSPGQVGAGYDVLQFMRNEPGYSPLCEVWRYNATVAFDPDRPELYQGPKDETSVLAMDPAPTRYLPTPQEELSGFDRRYVYCLQVVQQVP